MSIKLNPSELEWIKQEYLAGRDIHDIVVDTGISASNIKRALAESGVMYLHWYKTKNENELLLALKEIDIHTVKDLENQVWA